MKTAQVTPSICPYCLVRPGNAKDDGHCEHCWLEITLNNIARLEKADRIMLEPGAEIISESDFWKVAERAQAERDFWDHLAEGANDEDPRS